MQTAYFNNQNKRFPVMHISLGGFQKSRVGASSSATFLATENLSDRDLEVPFGTAFPSSSAKQQARLALP
jgi:hypothetical protein